MEKFKWNSPIHELYDYLYAKDWDDVKQFRRCGKGRKGLSEYDIGHQKVLLEIEKKTFNIIEKKNVSDQTLANFIFYMLIDNYNRSLSEENYTRRLNHWRMDTWVEGYLLWIRQSYDTWLSCPDLKAMDY